MLGAEHWIAVLDLHFLLLSPFYSVSLPPCGTNCCFKFIHLFYQGLDVKTGVFCHKTPLVNTFLVFLTTFIAQQVKKTHESNMSYVHRGLNDGACALFRTPPPHFSTGFCSATIWIPAQSLRTIRYYLTMLM